MQHFSIRAGILILVLATSAFGCASGSGSDPTDSCHRSYGRGPCIGGKSGPAVTKESACHTLESSQRRCSLRSLAQFQFAEFRRFEISSPLRRASGKASPGFNSRIVVSSIGSPETDRGPPHS